MRRRILVRQVDLTPNSAVRIRKAVNFDVDSLVDHPEMQKERERLFEEAIRNLEQGSDQLTMIQNESAGKFDEDCTIWYPHTHPSFSTRLHPELQPNFFFVALLRAVCFAVKSRNIMHRLVSKLLC
jgi:hypothetical protein